MAALNLLNCTMMTFRAMTARNI